jgi:hypothetical protein
VAAVSWAATQTPETTLGNHSPTKAGFLSANQMEVFCFGSLATYNELDTSIDQLWWAECCVTDSSVEPSEILLILAALGKKKQKQRMLRLSEAS